jgi:hypothetical protein
MNDGLQEFEIGGAGKRPPSGQQFVQHHAKRENVAAHIQGFSGGLLRRHVSNGADNDAGARLASRDRARRCGWWRTLRSSAADENAQIPLMEARKRR